MKNKVKNGIKKISIISILIVFACIFFAGCGQTALNVYVDGISISKKNLYLAEGQTSVISAQVFPFNANNQNYTFESSNNDVVTCEDGFVVAKKAGNATIFVYSEEGGYKDSCNVLVTTAKDNLQLNSYNNMNMPAQEIEPILNNENFQNEYQSQTTSAKNNRLSFPNSFENKKDIFKQYASTSQNSKPSPLKRFKKFAYQKVNNEIQDDIEAGKNVLNDVKDELEQSIKNLQSQKNMFAGLFQNQKNSIVESFNNFQNEIFDEITQTKIDMIDCIGEIKDKLDTGEYTVETKDMNGVTFVVVKNNLNNSNMENV